jgi:hypothetical protein
MSNSSNTSTGIGLGTVIAAIISWTTNHSVLWAILHGFFGWFYVIYYALGYGRH